jgi:hypothetical protein
MRLSTTIFEPCAPAFGQAIRLAAVRDLAQDRVSDRRLIRGGSVNVNTSIPLMTADPQINLQRSPRLDGAGP